MYTAFLFGQAEGRDFWRTPVFPFHLIVQSFLSGSAVIILISPFIPMGVILANSLTNLLLVTIVLDLLLLWSEFSMSHASEVAARAAKNITQGEYREIYWWGAIFC